jgi:hypothetical protein
MPATAVHRDHTVIPCTRDLLGAPSDLTPAYSLPPQHHSVHHQQERCLMHPEHCAASDGWAAVPASSGSLQQQHHHHNHPASSIVNPSGNTLDGATSKVAVQPLDLDPLSLLAASLASGSFLLPSPASRGKRLPGMAHSSCRDPTCKPGNDSYLMPNACGPIRTAAAAQQGAPGHTGAGCTMTLDCGLVLTATGTESCPRVEGAAPTLHWLELMGQKGMLL